MATAAKIYKLLGNESLWELAHECHQLLTKAEVPYAICGGVAVCLHGYQRNTTDLDLLINSEDAEDVKAVLETAGLEWLTTTKEFRSQSGVLLQFLYTGSRAGKDSEVRLPDPKEEGVTDFIEQLPVLRLSKLIECKLACGEGSLRRTHKDFADVVELIVIRNLDSSFARHLHKSLRKTFRELVRRARDDV